MGLRVGYIRYINDLIVREFGHIDGLSMLELGNQTVRKSARKEFGKTGKECYEGLGMEHCSIDLNGKDGALKLDLSKDILKDDWNNHFHVITNSGTTEHIEPFTSQYECFKNIHNFMSVGGISIHIIPDYSQSKKKNFFKHKHCNNYYSASFFKMLAKENDYTLLDSRKHGTYIRACVRKDSNLPFMLDGDLFLSKITRREDGRTYSYKNGRFTFG